MSESSPDKKPIRIRGPRSPHPTKTPFGDRTEKDRLPDGPITAPDDDGEVVDVDDGDSVNERKKSSVIFGAQKKITEELKHRVLSMVVKGVRPATALLAAGVRRREMDEWATMARGGVEPAATFFEELQQATAMAEVRDLAAIDEAAQAGSWQANAWKLERTRPESYALVTVQRVEGQLDIGSQEAKSPVHEALLNAIQRLLPKAAAAEPAVPPVPVVVEPRGLGAGGVEAEHGPGGGDPVLVEAVGPSESARPEGEVADVDAPGRPRIR